MEAVTSSVSVETVVVTLDVTTEPVAVVVVAGAVEVKVVADPVLTTVDVDVVGVIMHEQILLTNDEARLFNGAGHGAEVLARLASLRSGSGRILAPSGLMMVAARSLRLAAAAQLAEGPGVNEVPLDTVVTTVSVVTVLGKRQL